MGLTGLREISRYSRSCSRNGRFPRRPLRGKTSSIFAKDPATRVSDFSNYIAAARRRVGQGAKRWNEHSDLYWRKTSLPTRGRGWSIRVSDISGGHFRCDSQKLRAVHPLGWRSVPRRRVQFDNGKHYTFTDVMARSTEALNGRIRPAFYARRWRKRTRGPSQC